MKHCEVFSYLMQGFHLAQFFILHMFLTCSFRKFGVVYHGYKEHDSKDPWYSQPGTISPKGIVNNVIIMIIYVCI